MYRRRIQPRRRHIKRWRFKQPKPAKVLLFTKSIRHFFYGQKKTFIAISTISKQKVTFLPTFFRQWHAFRSALLTRMFSEWFFILLKEMFQQTFHFYNITVSTFVTKPWSLTNFLTPQSFWPLSVFLFSRSYHEVECMNILKMNHYLRREVEMVDLIEEFFSPYRVFKIGGTIQKLFKAFTKNSIHFSPTKRLKADWLRLKFLQLTPNRLKALVANNSEMFYINWVLKWQNKAWIRYMDFYQLQKKDLFNQKWWVNPRWLKHFRAHHRHKLHLFLTQWWKFMFARTRTSYFHCLVAPRRYLNLIRTFLGKIKLRVNWFTFKWTKRMYPTWIWYRVLKLARPKRLGRSFFRNYWRILKILIPKHFYSSFVWRVKFSRFVKGFVSYLYKGQLGWALSRIETTLVARLKQSLYTLWQRRTHFWDSLNYYGMRRIWKPKAWFGNKRRYKNKLLHAIDFKDKDLHLDRAITNSSEVWAPITLFMAARQELRNKVSQEIRYNRRVLPPHRLRGFMNRMRHPASWKLSERATDDIWQAWKYYHQNKPNLQLVYLCPPRIDKKSLGPKIIWKGDPKLSPRHSRLVYTTRAGERKSNWWAEITKAS